MATDTILRVTGVKRLKRFPASSKTAGRKVTSSGRSRI